MLSTTTKLPAFATPQQSTAAFVQAINEARLDDAARCFAKNACLLTPDSTAIRGRGEIRAILAQMIALRTSHAPEAAAPEPVRTAVDPICGMNVMVSDSTPHLEVGGEDFYFCCDGCRTTYAAQHAHAG